MPHLVEPPRELWANWHLSTKILVVSLPLIVISVAAAGLVAVAALHALGESAISTTSTSGAITSSEVEDTLRQAGQSDLLQLAQDQAALADTEFGALADAANLLATSAQMHWDDPDVYDQRYTFTPDEVPPDPTMATLYSIAPSADPTAAAADLERTSRMEDLLIAIGTAGRGQASPTIGTETGVMQNYPWFDSNPEGYDPRQRPWYRAGIGTDHLVWDVFTDAASGELQVAAIRRITDPGGRPVGVVNVSFTGDVAQQFTSAVLRGQGYSFVVDHDGNVLVGPRVTARDPGWDQELGYENVLQSPSARLRDVAARMVAGESGVASVTLAEGERYIAFAPLKSTGWSLAIVVPIEEVVGPATRISALVQTIARSVQDVLTAHLFRAQAEFLAILVVIILATSGAMTAFSRTLTRRLRRLSHAANALEAGTLSDAEIGLLGRSKGGDELASLLRLFARTAREVKAREQELRQEVQALNIEIDRVKAAQQVAEITDSDYFRQLQARASEMRGTRGPGSGPNGSPPSEPEAGDRGR